MPHTRIFPIVLAIGLVLLLQPVFGQKRKVDVRALLGYTAGLEDTPPHAWVGGGSVTAAVGPRLRLGVEVLQANMFGKYGDFKEPRHACHSGGGVRIFSGPAFQPLPGNRGRLYSVSCPRTKRATLLRFLASRVRVAQAGELQSRRRIGCPVVLDRALLRGPGTPYRYDSLATFNGRSRLCFLRERQARFAPR